MQCIQTNWKSIQFVAFDTFICLVFLPDIHLPPLLCLSVNVVLQMQFNHHCPQGIRLLYILWIHFNSQMKHIELHFDAIAFLKMFI